MRQGLASESAGLLWIGPRGAWRAPIATRRTDPRSTCISNDGFSRAYYPMGAGRDRTVCGLPNPPLPPNGLELSLLNPIDKNASGTIGFPSAFRLKREGRTTSQCRAPHRRRRNAFLFFRIYFHLSVFLAVPIFRLLSNLLALRSR